MTYKILNTILFLAFPFFLLSQENITAVAEEMGDNQCSISRERYLCFNLGISQYERGDRIGAKESWTIACDWGSAGGLPLACYNVGKMLQEEDELDEALKYYQYACRKGSPMGEKRACYALGVLRYEMNLVSEAKTDFEMACAFGEGVLEACANRGAIALDEADFDTNERYWNISCEKGLANECFKLGFVYQSTNRPELASEFYTKACEGKNPKGCAANAVAAAQRGQIQEAKNLFEVSCELDDTKSCINLGILLFQEKEFAESLKLFTNACQNSSILMDREMACFYAQMSQKAMATP